jgi:hypothetical protein
MNATREQVYDAIDTERDYQDKKWAGHSHEVGAYLTMLRTYVARAEEAWTSNSGDAPALEVVRKITAIGVHCMEQHGAPHRK